MAVGIVANLFYLRSLHHKLNNHVRQHTRQNGEP
jgi:hypothetical protein